jgi:hypothetical protein
MRRNTNINKNTLVCPKGQVMRKSFTRKFKPNIISQGFTVRRKGKLYTVHPTNNTIYIPKGCVKLPSTTGKIGKLRKGDLIKYGYQYRLSDRMRHDALKRAIDKYGAVSVYRKLDAFAKLSAHSAPSASTIFSADREWVHKNYVK